MCEITTGDPEPCGVSACWRIIEDPDTQQPCWTGSEEDWKEGVTWEPGQALILDPAQFPVGTFIYVEGRGRGSAPLDEPEDAPTPCANCQDAPLDGITCPTCTVRALRLEIVRLRAGLLEALYHNTDRGGCRQCGAFDEEGCQPGCMTPVLRRALGE